MVLRQNFHWDCQGGQRSIACNISSADSVQPCFKLSVVGAMCFVAFLEVLFQCFLLYYLVVIFWLTYLAGGIALGLALILELLVDLGVFQFIGDVAEDWFFDFVFRVLVA